MGIDTDKKAHAEIKKIQTAYNSLEKSGTLSQQELARAAALARHKTYELERSLNDLRPSLKDVADEVQGLVTRAGGLALISREAMQFETAMAGVKKVVDGTPEQFSDLSDSLKGMAGNLGVMPEQLANIAAQGGQLGVPIEQLEQFTQMAASMSVAFGISADEAGEAAAKMANVFNLPIEAVGQLGDAINVLGNNTAAKEKDIINAMTRIGGNAKQFGLAADQAAALADAFIALGKPPEVAATAINALLGKLQTAQTQGKGFQEGLESIGMSADEMAAQIAANPQQALSGFLQKLEKLDKQSRSIALAKMFGQEYSDDIALLVGSLGEYNKALDLVADKTKTAGAMQAELDNALNTTEGKLNQAKGAMAATAATIGEALLPMIANVASGAANMAEAVGAVAKEYPKITQLITIYAALRVGVQAFNSVSRLTGGIASASFLKAEVASTGLRKKLGETQLAAAALNSELAKAGQHDLKILKDNLGGIKAKLASVARGVAGAFAAFETGASIGKWARDNFDWVASVGDSMGKMVAYVDAIFTDRTFDDVKKFYRTKAEVAKEAAEAEKKEEEASQKAAEASKKAAEEETARILDMQQQYRSLKAEHHAVAQSMAVLAASGNKNGEAYQMLQAQAEALKDKMAGLRDELGKANAAFEFDTGPIAEAKKALEGLGLSAQQLQTGMSDSASKAVDDFSLAAKQFGTDAESMGRIFNASLKKMDSPEAVEALKKRLGEVGKEAGLTAAEIEKIGDTAPKAADKVSAAFAKIGVDVEAVKSGISSKAKEAFSDWQEASQAAREAGVKDSRLIRAGFEEMMGKLQSKAEFTAFKAQLEQSGDAAKLTSEQLNRLNKAASDGARSAKTAYEGMAEAIKKAGNAADLNAVAEQAKLAMEAGSMSAAQYDSVLAAIQERTAQLEAETAKAGDVASMAHEKAAVAAEKHAAANAKAAQSAHEAASATDKASSSTEHASKSITDYGYRMSQTYGYVKLTNEQLSIMNHQFQGVTFGEKAKARTVLMRDYAEQIGRANEAMQALSAAESSGAVNASVLHKATMAVDNAASKLGATTLAQFRAAIDSAKAKMMSLRQEASDTVASLRAELAELEGDTEASYKLAYQQKMVQLRSKLEEAQKSGDSATIGSISEALRLQEQIYSKQREQRTREAAKAAREAASAQSSALNLDNASKVMVDTSGAVSALNEVLNQRDKKVADAAVQQLADELRNSLVRNT